MKRIKKNTDKQKTEQKETPKDLIPKHIPTDDEIAKAMMKMEGREAQVADMFGLTVATIKKRIKNNPDLIAIKSHVREYQIDIAEDSLMDLIKRNKNFSAIKFFLESHGKDRGYGKEATEQSNSQTGVLLINNLSINNNLTTDEWADIARKQKIERDKEESQIIDIKKED